MHSFVHFCVCRPEVGTIDRLRDTRHDTKGKPQTRHDKKGKPKRYRTRQQGPFLPQTGSLKSARYTDICAYICILRKYVCSDTRHDKKRFLRHRQAA